MTVDTIDSILQMIFGHIAGGDDLAIFLAEEGVHIAAPLPANTDTAHSNPVARRYVACISKNQ
jgi:hypothetical protein